MMIVKMMRERPAALTLGIVSRNNCDNCIVFDYRKALFSITERESGMDILRVQIAYSNA